MRYDAKKEQEDSLILYYVHEEDAIADYREFYGTEYADAHPPRVLRSESRPEYVYVAYPR